MKKIIFITHIFLYLSIGSIAQVKPLIEKPQGLQQITEFTTVPFFDKMRPVCIVLIHGITNSVATSARLISEGKSPDRPVNTLKYARHYWSYEFVQGLLGNISDPIYTFSTAANATGALDSNPDIWETKLTNNATAKEHILTGTERPAPYADGPTNCNGFVSVMMTYRDGSLSLKKQAANTAAQIRSLYTEVYGSWPASKQPQLVLLCHSGGGLVARTICSKPASLGGGISSLGNRAIPIETFTSTENSNFDFIRNKTLYIITLATPHEGAPIAKVADQIGQHLTSTIVIGQDLADQDPQTTIMKELCPNIMQDYNRGPLNPTKCKRSDGTLIPLYCFGGRAAGGPFYFNDPNKHDLDLSTPDGGIPYTKSQISVEKKINGANNRKAYESYGLLKADYLTTLLYGITSTAMIAPELLVNGINGKSTGFDMRFIVADQNQSDLDIVKIRNNGLLNCLDPAVYNLADFIAGPKIFFLRDNWSDIKNDLGLCTGRYKNNGASTKGDGMIDCDGFVPIISSLGVNLGTNVKNYYDHTTGGSWYRFYRSAADYDNHGSIMTRYEVGEFIRTNITYLPRQTNLIGTGIVTSTAAGPYVKSSGEKSSWVK